MKVFYDKRQSVGSLISESPSAGKPRLVVRAWEKLGLPIELMKVQPLTVDELCLAHSPTYVKGILECRIENGFRTKDKAVAQSLRWTTGSFATAAVYALQNRECTFSPTSGFHHAQYDRAAGYCTFSGLTIAAILLHKRHNAKRIGILDLDSHYGNGTDDTLHKTGSTDFVEHYSLGGDDVDVTNNQLWLNKLPDLIRRRFSDVDVLFYQAGADCHIDDPLVYQGHFTTEQMSTRDEVVYAVCRELDLPVVTNLAGGYQIPVERVIALHNQTAIAYLKAHDLNK